jgi:uncharacterized protein (DUF4415 family)
MLAGEKLPYPSRTDWARLDAMTEEDIERGALSDPDNPPIDPATMTWEIIEPTPKKSIHLRVDADVLEWFHENSTRHLTHMNAVLRHYMLMKLKRPKESGWPR